MQKLNEPLTLEMIREAAEDIVSQSIEFWADCRTDLMNYMSDIITDILEDIAEEVESKSVVNSDEIDEIVTEFCNEFSSDLDMARGNGLAHDIVNNGLIYDMDILDYYATNPAEVDQALRDTYGSLGEFDTISDAMSTGVILACENEADHQIGEVLDAFDNWAAESMMETIFS